MLHFAELDALAVSIADGAPPQVAAALISGPLCPADAVAGGQRVIDIEFVVRKDQRDAFYGGAHLVRLRFQVRSALRLPPAHAIVECGRAAGPARRA